MPPRQTLFHYSLIHENRINLFDSVRLATLRYEILSHHKKINHRVAYSAKNFAKSFFYNVTKVQNAGLPMVRSQMN